MKSCSLSSYGPGPPFASFAWTVDRNSSHAAASVLRARTAARTFSASATCAAVTVRRGTVTDSFLCFKTGDVSTACGCASTMHLTSRSERIAQDSAFQPWKPSR